MTLSPFLDFFIYFYKPKTIWSYSYYLGVITEFGLINFTIINLN